MSLRLLAVAASLRRGSLNRKLLGNAVVAARQAGAEVVEAEFAEFDLPAFNADIQEVSGFPPGAIRFRERLEAAHGLLLASPEYNYSMPGVLKNLIDWVSRMRPVPFRGRSALLLATSNGPIGGIRGLWQLRIRLEGWGCLSTPTCSSCRRGDRRSGRTECSPTRRWLSACRGRTRATSGRPGRSRPGSEGSAWRAATGQASDRCDSARGTALALEALRTAQVRARVSGVVVQRLFQEGSDGRAGQPLYRIDAEPYQAALDSAQATLQRAEAVLAQARQTLQRYEPLADSKVISQQDLSNARSAQRMAEAEAAAARAAVQTARINLGYASVVAPISGRIGRALVSEGGLVTAAEATPMALIQQVSSVYVNFTQSSAELLRLRRLAADNARQRMPSDAVAVRIVLDDGTELPQTGRLLFSDISVDPGSPQVTLRAEVPNPQGLLLPGQYVRVRLAQATLGGAMLLPQQAVPP